MSRNYKFRNPEARFTTGYVTGLSNIILIAVLLMLNLAKWQSVINCTGFEFKLPLRSNLNYPVHATD